MDNYEKFKCLLEYFVSHIAWKENGSTSHVGFNTYIKPLIDTNNFVEQGQGYNNGTIQNQIRQWDEINNHKVFINIQPNYGSWKTRKCYLNWCDTGINIFCDWGVNNDPVGLTIGYAYWWKNPTSYDKLSNKTIKQLGLFQDVISQDLKTFLDDFTKEITDYDQHKGKYYEKELNWENMKNIEKYLNILRFNKNLILTGAPGTGKTYLAKQIAQQMILGEIKEKMTLEEENQFKEQCGFVQFHPSYDYTDFVEGLRPIQDDNGQIGFERKDGEFKNFCKKSLEHSTNKKGSGIIEERFDKSWQQLLDFVRENIAKGVLTKIGIWEYGLSSTDSLKYTSIDTPSKYTFTINKKNVFDAYRGLQARPSGHFQKYIEDVVKFLIENFDLQPYNKSGDISKGQDDLPYVFIIDEINRGEISKIFGELFFSIDPGYRGKEKDKVKTQYQNLIEEDDVFYDGFYVPDNVYIIGTMNDIDRSVESMDFAFRRRFAFKEIKATDRVEMLDDMTWKDGAIKRMYRLNAKIEKIEGLSSAYHIGPAYFLKLKNYNGDFDQLWENHLEGLLFEYLRGMTDVPAKLKALAEEYSYTKANRYV